MRNSIFHFDFLKQKNLFLCFFIAIGIYAIGQTSQQLKQKKDNLQAEMQKLKKEIAEMESLIKATSAKKQQNVQLLNNLKQNIKKREAQIAAYSTQVKSIENDILSTQQTINTKEDEVDQAKTDYARLIRDSYRRKLFQNDLNFVLEASNYNDAVTRYTFMKTIANARKSQAKGIEEKIVLLENEKEGLEKSRLITEELLHKQAAQKAKLESEKNLTNQEIAKLSDKEKKIRAGIVQKNKAAQDLNNKIDRIIQQEIALAKKRAIEAAHKKATEEAKKNNQPVKPVIEDNADESYLSPKEMALSQDFVSNKGKLPWPVAKGNIVSYFGKREHATIKGVYVENNGIDIKSAEGSSARALFDGVVVSVFSMPTTQTCIIVKHGDFFTVYSNIEEATVKANDKITTKQSLGKLYKDPEDNSTKVHLEIWHGKEKLNPSTWIAN